MNKFWVLALLLAFFSCQNYEEVGYGDIQKIDFKEYNLKKIGLTVDVPLNNPNNNKIVVKSADFKVWMNNQFLGDLSLDESFHLEGNKEKIYSIPLSLSFGKNPLNAFGLLQGIMNDSVNIALKGSIEARTFIFNKSIPVELNEKMAFQ